MNPTNFNEGQLHEISYEELAYINFRYNFRQIRQAYSLTLADMADILCLRSRSTLSDLENGNKNKMLAMDSMMQLSKVFAVSLDWLFGYTNQPYNESQILDIEDCLLNIYQTYDPDGLFELHTTDKAEIWLPDNYLDSAMRKKTYSLPVRANICFLFHCSMLNELYDQLPTSLREVNLENRGKEDINMHFQQKKSMYESCILKLVRGTEINDVYKYKRGSYFTDLKKTTDNNLLLLKLLADKEQAVVAFDITQEIN